MYFGIKNECPLKEVYVVIVTRKLSTFEYIYIYIYIYSDVESLQVINIYIYIYIYIYIRKVEIRKVENEERDQKTRRGVLVV